MRAELSVLSVPRQSTIRDAIAAIDRGNLQICLVIDIGGRLIGVVTDGDVRRGLLAGAKLEDPVAGIMVRQPRTALIGTSRDTIRRLMVEHSLHQVPIVDSAGTLVDLVHVDEFSAPVTRETRVILMAGGLGMRLRPLTEATPKPMLRIGSRPLLELIVESFVEQGFTRFTITVNYLGEMIRRHFGDGSTFGARIDYVEETDRLGTAGALSLLSEKPEAPFIVMNADLITSVRYASLLAFHDETAASATVCAQEFAVQVPYGVLRSNGHDLIAIEEKPTVSQMINAGIYVLSPSTLDYLEPGRSTDMPVLLQRLLEDRRRVSVFPLRETWLDIGRHEDLERARMEFSDGSAT